MTMTSNSSHATPGHGIDTLDPREIEVVRLLAEGASDDQIADALDLSPKALAGCIDAAFETMGVSSRSQAVRWALWHGVVPVDTVLETRDRVFVEHPQD